MLEQGKSLPVVLDQFWRFEDRYEQVPIKPKPGQYDTFLKLHKIDKINFNHPKVKDLALWDKFKLLVKTHGDRTSPVLYEMKHKDQILSGRQMDHHIFQEYRKLVHPD